FRRVLFRSCTPGGRSVSAAEGVGGVRGARGWVIAAIVSLAIAGIAYVLQPRPDSPQHSSTSDAANGVSALVLFAQAMGHPTIEIGSSFDLPAQDGVMFVFTP